MSCGEQRSTGGRHLGGGLQRGWTTRYRYWTHIAHQPDWQHIATYGDQGFGVGRSGLSRLLAEAPGRVDLVVVDGYGRLSPNRREQTALLAQLGGAGCGSWCWHLRPVGGWPGWWRTWRWLT